MLGKLPVPGRHTIWMIVGQSWLLVVLGFNGPFKQYFSLAVSQREGERGEKG